MENENRSIKSICKTYLEGGRLTTVIVLIGLCGIALLAVSSLFGKESAPTAGVMDMKSYTQELEERLEAMVSSVRGAGAADVMVTLENGVEYIYANEEKTNSDHTQNEGGGVSVRDDNQKTVVTVDGGDGKQGLLVTEIQPTVRGVVVACEGATNEQVALQVKEAVKTALNITNQRVCVMPLS